MAYKDPEKRKSYKREYSKKYEKTYRDKRSKLRRARKDNLRQIILDHFKSHSCIDCGETDPIVLEFDHRDSSDKKFTIANVVSHNLSVKILNEEIAKCDVRCANCHRRRTAEQFGWYKNLK